MTVAGSDLSRSLKGSPPAGQWLLRWRAAWAIIRAELELQKQERLYEANPSDVTRERFERARSAAEDSQHCAWDSVGRGPGGTLKEESGRRAEEPGPGFLFDDDVRCGVEVTQRLGCWRGRLQEQGFLKGAGGSDYEEARLHRWPGRLQGEGFLTRAGGDDEAADDEEPGSPDAGPSGEEAGSDDEEPGDDDEELEGGGFASGTDSAEAGPSEADFAGDCYSDATRSDGRAVSRSNGRATPPTSPQRAARGRAEQRRRRASGRTRRQRHRRVLPWRLRAPHLRLGRRLLGQPRRRRRRRQLRRRPGQPGPTPWAAEGRLASDARQKRGHLLGGLVGDVGTLSRVPLDPGSVDRAGALNRVPVDYGRLLQLKARPRAPD